MEVKKMIDRKELVETLAELLDDADFEDDIKDKYDSLYGAIEDLIMRIKYE